MPSVEERVAYLEGRVGEHGNAMNEFREAVRQINGRLEGLSSRVDALDLKIDRARDDLAGRIDTRFDTLDQKVSRTFLWVVGVQMTVLLAVIGALIRG